MESAVIGQQTLSIQGRSTSNNSGRTEQKSNEIEPNDRYRGRAVQDDDGGRRRGRPRFGFGDVLRVLSQELLRGLRQELRAGNPGGESGSKPTGYPEDPSESAVAGQVIGFVRSFSFRLTVGAGAATETGPDESSVDKTPPDDAANIVDASLAGVDSGIRNAESVLENQGALTVEIQQTFVRIRSSIREGLAAIPAPPKPDKTARPAPAEVSVTPPPAIETRAPARRRAPVPAAEAPAPANNAAPQRVVAGGSLFERSQSVSVSLTTADGDRVTLSLNSMAGFQIGLAGAANGENAAASGRISFERAGDFSFAVEGELDRGELRAISKLLKRISKIANQFFGGNIEKALNKAAKLENIGGKAAEEIQAFDVNLTQTISYVTQAYGTLIQPTAPAPADEAATPSTDDSEPAAAEVVNTVAETPETDPLKPEAPVTETPADSARDFAGFSVEIRAVYAEFTADVSFPQPGQVIADLLDAAFDALRSREDLSESDDTAGAQSAFRNLLLELDAQAAPVEPETIEV